MRQPNVIFCEEFILGFPTSGQPPSYDKWFESYAWSKVVKCGKTRKNSENHEKSLNVITFYKIVQLPSYLDTSKI